LAALFLKLPAENFAVWQAVMIASTEEWRSGNKE
jgi:hypothetical protein